MTTFLCGRLKKLSKIVEIPMWGVNKSLNVMVSLGIVLYEVMENSKNFRKKGQVPSSSTSKVGGAEQRWLSLRKRQNKKDSF